MDEIPEQPTIFVFFFFLFFFSVSSILGSGAYLTSCLFLLFVFISSIFIGFFFFTNLFWIL